MIETTIMLREEKEWPAVDILDQTGKVIAHRRRTVEELTDAMNAAIQIPGLNTRMDDADQDTYRHARDRHQDAGRDQVAGANLAELERVASRSKQSCARCRGPRAFSLSE